MMKTTATSLNELWANLIVEEFSRHGISEYCLSPGSRSTPLTIAAARDSGTRCTMHFDERGAAFRALGYARATGQPAVLVCTSGTAGANYYPAVIEAWQSRVPMLVVTANRPPELWDRGANQTIDQTHLFGRHTKWYHRLGCPEADIDPACVLSIIDQAVSRAVGTPPGPVHLDCPFREPLAPIGDAVDYSRYLDGLRDWLDSSAPLGSETVGPRVAEAAQLDRFATDVNEIERGLLVVGRLDANEQVDAVVRLAKRLNWPMIADIQSGLRTGRDLPQLIGYADLVLSARTHEEAPVTVLHLGDQPTSTRLHRYLGSVPLERYVHVTSHTRGSDPNMAVTRRIIMDIGAFCDLIGPLVVQSSAGGWLESWKRQSATVADIIRQQVDGAAALTESLVARLVAHKTPDNCGLWVASSMPVRDLDSFADPGGPRVVVGANRGASGIDGTIASACGFAAGLQRPVTLLIGDLAALHDLNSLAMAAGSEQPLAIVIVNNDGGGIFHFLPVAECDDVFEKYFGTGHALSFADAARQFDLPYLPVSTGAELAAGLQQLHEENQSGIIEVHTDRRENLLHHSRLVDSVKVVLQTRQ